MALNAIKPAYYQWVKSSDTTEKTIRETLKQEFLTIDKAILGAEISDKDLQNKISDLRSKFLYASLRLNIDQYNQSDKDFSKNLAELQLFKNNIDSINQYETLENNKSQKQNISILAWASVIFLPLGLIASFYGMNFKSMGSPSIHDTKGPFGYKYGQAWVFFLFIVSIFIVVVVIKSYQ